MIPSLCAFDFGAVQRHELASVNASTVPLAMLEKIVDLRAACFSPGCMLRYKFWEDLWICSSFRRVGLMLTQSSPVEYGTLEVGIDTLGLSIVSE